jgi:hypothetical protein
MPAPRKVFRFLLIFLVAFIFVSLIPSFHHRRDFDRAFMAYYKEPTPENAAALRAQQRINENIDLEFAAVGALILVILGYGIYGVVRLANYGSKRIRGSNSQS